MLTALRKIRQRLLTENRISRYLIYAAGEILLVVIGILIALQVNNSNIHRIERQQEEKYLKNMSLDLEKNLERLDFLIAFRKSRVKGDQELIDHINGNHLIEDLNKLSFNVINSVMEERFSPYNNTYAALSNSGNLNLISSEPIKQLLLELEELYKINEFAIAHETHDYQEYISKPVFRSTNIEKLFPVYAGVKTAADQQIQTEDFDALFQLKEYKNALFVMKFMSESILPTYAEIKAKSEEIHALIAKELEQD